MATSGLPCPLVETRMEPSGQEIEFLLGALPAFGERAKQFQAFAEMGCRLGIC